MRAELSSEFHARGTGFAANAADLGGIAPDVFGHTGENVMRNRDAMMAADHFNRVNDVHHLRMEEILENDFRRIENRLRGTFRMMV
jgi:hypothetical protein